MLANVQQATIRPVIEATVAKGALVHTDEYDIYGRLDEWGYGHKTVCHARGEYARDEDGDGFCEVHVNTAEGFWSLLRSWLRPHRGISQEKLPLYLGFFQLVHNARCRGKALLGTLIAGLVAPTNPHHPETREETQRVPRTASGWKWGCDDGRFRPIVRPADARRPDLAGWQPTPQKRSVRAAFRDHRMSRPAPPGQHVGQPLSPVPRRRARHLWRWPWKRSSNAPPGSTCTRARWSPASSSVPPAVG